MTIQKAFNFFAITCLMGHAFAVKPMSDEEYLRVNGGMCQTRGRGWVVAIDCRPSVNFSDYEQGSKFVAQELSTIISNLVGTSFSVATASDRQRETGANVAVFIIEDKNLPITLSCPEERWSMLNAAKVKADSPDNKKFQRRMSILFQRQCCRVLGSDEAPGTETCFYTVLKLSDLDDIKSTDLTLNSTTSITETMKHRGMEPIDWGTYRDACETGRAHMPTNDIQRKVWNEVHAAPKKPMKIVFDPKKGR